MEKKKTVRLYRAEDKPGIGKPVSDWMKSHLDWQRNKDSSGRWFTDDLTEVRWYINNEYPNGRIVSIEVPIEVAEKYRVLNMNDKGSKDFAENPKAFSRRPEKEYFLPKEIADRKREYQEKTNLESRMTLKGLFFILGIAGLLTSIFLNSIVITGNTIFNLSRNRFFPTSIFVFIFSVAMLALASREGQNELEEKVSEINYVETSKGSRYAYLPGGKTQRYKKVTGEMNEPQDALVFIPDYETVKKAVPKEYLERNVLGKNRIQYQETILDYIQNKGKKVYIVDEKGKILRTNKEVQVAEQVYLSFLDKKKNEVDFSIPVSKEPKVDYMTFDTRRFEKNGEQFTERHIGHEVKKIVYKNGRMKSK
ncbi:MAG: hypothetical protein KKC19_04275 [Nanoarchaeota archaeon]|nr:hypothetical protein [Nanoarchaeota archaeon]